MQPAQPTLILLIEDVATTAAVVKRYLEVAPGTVEVELATSLQEALAKLAARLYDLVIADLNLPDSKGLATLDRLTQATDRLIIVLTIEEGREIRDAAIARGAYDFLQKDRLSEVALGQIVRLATVQARTFRDLRESEAARVRAEGELRRVQEQLAQQSRTPRK